jgi:hypothetical protein
VEKATLLLLSPIWRNEDLCVRMKGLWISAGAERHTVVKEATEAVFEARWR